MPAPVSDEVRRDYPRTVRLTRDESARLDAIAAERQVTPSDVIRDALAAMRQPA